MCLCASARLGVRTRQGDEQEDASASCRCRQFLYEPGKQETEAHIWVLPQWWKFWVLLSCSLLDNSFISVADYYWRGRYRSPLGVNCFCQMYNPEKIYGEICLPFMSLKFSWGKRKNLVSLYPATEGPDPDQIPVLPPAIADISAQWAQL